jgi:L-ascorbate metabolism protein UlaG (beta-lactamase superfamily)
MMFKTLFFIFITLGIQATQAKVEARWLTVASVLIDDGKTKLLFDPAWTRPGLKHVLGFEKLRSDEKLVTKILKKNGLEKIDAVFASHSHFDHVLDAPMVSKLAGAIFYVDESSERLASAYKEPKIRTERVSTLKEIKVGDFTITPIVRAHSKLFQLFDFLPGPVPANTELSFWDYHCGEAWYYLIKHPEGTYVVNQGAESHVEELKKLTSSVDVLFQGLASRKDDEMIINGFAKAFEPKIFVPLHFDNFFADFNSGAESELPGMGLEKILTKLKKAYPTMKLDRPTYGKPISLEIK